MISFSIFDTSFSVILYVVFLSLRNQSATLYKAYKVVMFICKILNIYCCQIFISNSFLQTVSYFLMKSPMELPHLLQSGQVSLGGTMITFHLRLIYMLPHLFLVLDTSSWIACVCLGYCSFWWGIFLICIVYKREIYWYLACLKMICILSMLIYF